MSVPPFVPPDVPAAGSMPASRLRARKTSNRNVGTASYLTRTGDGWRFQMRLPGRFALAGASSTIRGALGPRSRSEARRLGQQLAALCTAICEAADVGQQETDMTIKPLDEKETALVQQVVNACQQAIKTAVNQPSRAIGLAKGLGAALTSLRLVESEFGRGAAGNPAVIDNADAISRAALKDVLRLAPDPSAALDVLSTTSGIVPSLMSTTGLNPPSATPAAGVRTLPTFSELSERHIKMRIESNADQSEIQRHRIAALTFLPIVGNRRIDEYFPSHLQDYVSRMAYWPANATKRGEMEGLSVLGILDANKDLNLKPLARKTLKDGYVASIRTQARSLMADYRYRDPFAGARLRWPKTARPSKPREGIGPDVVNRIFRNGVGSGLLDEAMLPPFCKLTGRRLGLAVHLQGPDIRQKSGVWIAQTSGIVQADDGRWTRVPIKTDESMTFFVLHDFLVRIGFVDWARRQPGWIFAAAHEHPDPAKYSSKTMARLLRRSGAQAGEVFHSLRGDAIDEMREAEVDGRTRRLQVGHQLGDVHDEYGFRALSAVECRRLANLPLPEGIDWEIFRGLDFDAMAARRRTPGRRRK